MYSQPRNWEYVASIVKSTIVYSYDNNSNNNFNSSNRENRRIVHFEKDNTLLRTRLLLRSYLYYLFSCFYVNHSISCLQPFDVIKNVNCEKDDFRKSIADRKSRLYIITKYYFDFWGSTLSSKWSVL